MSSATMLGDAIRVKGNIEIIPEHSNYSDNPLRHNAMYVVNLFL